MTRKVLLAMTVGVAVIALLGVGVVFLVPGSGAVAGVSAPGVEPQATSSSEYPYTIHIPCPSGWVSQLDIYTEGRTIEEWFPGVIFDFGYITVATTSDKYISGFAQGIAVAESKTSEVGETPLSNSSADMVKWAKDNQATLFAWAEGHAAEDGVYAPVAKQARVLPFLNGDNAYAVQVQGQWLKQPVNQEFLLIPKDKNQYFYIDMISLGMCEDELWHVQRTTTFTQNK